MPVRERVEFLLREMKLSQSDFSNRSGYSRAVLSHFLTGKTDKPRIDLLEALIKVFPTLNLNWLITGQGDIWDGPAPEGLEDLGTPAPTSLPGEDQALLNRLLRLKLEEVAQALKEKDPELYRALRLEEVLGKG